LVACTKDENLAIEGALIALRWRAGWSLFVRNGYLRYLKWQYYAACQETQHRI
jgi:hypothetical protein